MRRRTAFALMTLVALALAALPVLAGEECEECADGSCAPCSAACALCLCCQLPAAAAAPPELAPALHSTLAFLGAAEVPLSSEPGGVLHVPKPA